MRYPPLASGIFDQVGLPTAAMLSGTSTGPGSGGGVGTGHGTGIGSGRGRDPDPAVEQAAVPIVLADP